MTPLTFVGSLFSFDQNGNAHANAAPVARDAANKPDLADRWRAFHAANPGVYIEIERRALALFNGGRKRIGVKSIIEDIRDEGFRTTGDEWQLNNSFTAFYARELIARNPQLNAVIERRDSVADREVITNA